MAAIQKEEFGVNIVWHEIKKIWNWKILLLVAAFCGLFYSMSMAWHIGNIRTIHRMDFVGELVQRYGTAVTDEQMQAFFAEHFPPLIAKPITVPAQ
jgi:hypothetical protein